MRDAKDVRVVTAGARNVGVRRVLLAIAATIALLGTLVVGASPASADRGGVTEVLVLQGSDYGPVSASRDLSTVFRTVNFGLGLETIDIATGEATSISLPDDLPAKYAAGLSDDGGTLAVTGGWEGLETGDADGGFDDGFLLDVETGNLQALTGGAADSVNGVLAIDGDASLAVLVSFPLFDGPFASYSLWDDGTVTPLAIPDSFVSGSMQLSSDGSTLVYSRTLGNSIAVYARDLATGTEQVVSGGFGFGYYEYGYGYGYPGAGYSMSDDGSLVVWVEYSGTPNEFGEQDATVRAWNTAGTTVASYPVGGPGGGHVLISGDGLTVSGTSWAIVDYDTYEVETTLWQLNLATGNVETLHTDRSPQGNGISILGVDNDGSEILFVAQGGPGFPEPFEIGSTSDEDYYYIQSVMRWSADTPPVTTVVESGIQPALADQIGRLYEAYFGRAPDAGGLRYWIDQRAAGTNLATVSQAFASSPEFIDTYGDLDDSAFVELVYQNVLGRAADASGLEYWTDQLTAGVSRGWVMIGFSESPEFVAATGTSAPMSAVEGTIRRMYWVFLGRAATDADVVNWSDAGVSYEEIADIMATTDEYQDRFGEREFYEVFELAIGASLGRYSNEADYERWWMPLENGTLTIPQFLLQLANEPEVVARTGTTPATG